MNSSLNETRKKIDTIDEQIKALIMKRLDCSQEIAHEKISSGNTTIFRPDREEEILTRLGQDIPDERKAGYLAVVRKIMETSRMYQYGIIFDALGSQKCFEPLAEHLARAIKPEQKRVRVSLTRDNRPNAMSSILSMIGDYGYNMDRMELISQDEKQVTFELVIMGNLNDEKMKKLMFQLSRESRDFYIIYSY